MELLEKIEILKENLMKRATGKTDYNEEEYKKIRKEILDTKALGKYLPFFIEKYRNLDSFWYWIKNEFSTYAERRKYISESFVLIENYVETLEIGQLIPISEIEILSTEFLKNQIKKTEERFAIKDYDGVITNSRSMIEEVLLEIESKYHNNQRQKYDGDLNKLYTRVRKAMGIDESQQSSTIKKVLSGLFSIVSGIGELRNSASDAHPQLYKLNKRQTELVTNSSRIFVTYMIDLYIDKN